MSDQRAGLDGDGEDAMDDLMCAAAPRRQWTIGRYRFARYTRTEKPKGGRWEVTNTQMGRGVANYRTPLGAFLSLRRFEKETPRAQ